MEREVVKWYFEAIRLTLIKHNTFDNLVTKIWNMDETEIDQVQNLCTVSQVETKKW